MVSTVGENPAEQANDSSGLSAAEICPECERALVPAQWETCRRCGAPGRATSATSGQCPACRNAKLRFDAAVSLGPYCEALREAVLRTKGLHGEPLAAAAGKLLLHYRGDILRGFDAQWIVPVPIHWRRRLERASNSPEVVAAVLGRGLGVPVGRWLVRYRHTAPQATLPPSKRFENVRGAFRVRRGSSRLEGTRILLVDDILTTGATCSEAARMLKRAGAATVMAVVIARAARPGMT